MVYVSGPRNKWTHDVDRYKSMEFVRDISSVGDAEGKGDASSKSHALCVESAARLLGPGEHGWRDCSISRKSRNRGGGVARRHTGGFLKAWCKLYTGIEDHLTTEALALALVRWCQLCSSLRLL